MNVFSKISIFTLFSALLLFLLSKGERFAVFLNNTLCEFLRLVLNKISGLFPFSLFEFCLLLFPFFLIILLIKRPKIINIFSSLLLIFSLFIITVLIPYNAKSPLQYRGKITDVDIIDTAYILLERVNLYSESEFEDVSKIESARIKKLALSGAFTRFRTLGFYSFPTAEINVNMFLPDYIYNFTAYHEYSHLLGYMKEGEADMFAYLKLSRSENEFDRYSASLYALDFLLSDIYKFSKADYTKIYSEISERALSDIKEYRSLLASYPEIKIFERVSEGYHTIFDKASYSDFTRLVTLYHKTP